MACSGISKRVHNVVEFYKVLGQFSLVTSKVELDIRWKNICVCVASQAANQLKTYDLRKLGNTGNISKLHGDTF